jgi:hypothetical protein
VGLAVNRWGGTSTNGNLGVFTTTYGNGRVTDTNTTTQTQEFSGTSVHFGALVKPTRRVNLGFVFRPSFGMKLNSRAVGTSQHQDTRAAAAASSGNSTATYDGTLDWPQTIGAGLAVMPTDFLTFSADYTKTSWSKATFNHVYDYTSQSFNAQGQPVGTPYHQRIEQGSLLWPNYWDSRDPQTWSAHQTDSAQVRVGAEYVLRNLKLLNLVVVPLRVGFVSDGQMTMNAPTPTKATYTGMTAGFGLVWKKVSLDFAWIHMTGDSTYGYEGPVIGAGTSFSYQMNYRADGSSSFSSNRLFASTVIRF